MIPVSSLIPIYVFRGQLVFSKFNRYSEIFMKWRNCEIATKAYFGTCVLTKRSTQLPSYRLAPIIRDRYSNYKYLNSWTVTDIRSFCTESEATAASVRKALDDEEFQNILKDFAKDFGVDEENREILEDIRKNNENSNTPKSPDQEATSERTSETLNAYHSLYKERFKEFEDRDSQIIYSYEEEQFLEDKDFFHIDQEHEKHASIQQVQRGLTGVFDIEELIPILREEKLLDISVIQVPKHYHYADYMVLATAKSLRHARAVTEFLLKFYKMKKNKQDPFIKIEGEKLGTWKCMDMGNIVLHVLMEDVRALYDVESLWLLDSKYDSGGKVEEDTVLDMMQDEIEFLNCLKSEESIVTDHKSVK